jgi:hypothetical protein
MTVFKAKVSREFIERRDRKAKVFNAGVRGADAEFIEHHQVAVDPFQTLYEGKEYDTVHEVMGNIDYKQYSSQGVHVSPYIQKCIRSGKVHMLGIWKWYPKNTWVQLEEGQTIQYEVLDYVDAELALQQLDLETNRFSYPLN